MSTFGRRTISVILSVIMVLSYFAGMTFSVGAETNEDYEYEVLDDGTVEITKYIGSGTNLTIPAKIDGYEISGLGESAFSNTEITKITITNGIQRIGDYCFSSSRITDINLPNSIRAIGKGAFALCSNLKNIKLPNGVKRIEENTFQECTSLKEMDFFNGVISIGCNAFSNCWGLTKINIPNCVEDIEEYAFIGCWYVKEINIPDSVKTIGYDAFVDCNAKKVHIPNNLTEIKTHVFYGFPGLESVEIPGKIVSIEEKSFEGYKLKRVRIQKTVKHIDNLAFGNIATLSNNSFTVYGYAGSEAENYANRNNFNFVDMTLCNHSDLEFLNKKDATCTEHGYSGDVRCRKCGKITETGNVIHSLGFVDENEDNICDNCGLKHNQTINNNIENRILDLINSFVEFLKQIYDFINTFFNKSKI